MYYRRNGSLPGAAASNDPTFAKQTQDAFSSNPQSEFDDEVRHPAGAPAGGRAGHDDDDEYALLHQSEADDIGIHPGRPGSYGRDDRTGIVHDYDTSYGGAYGSHAGEDLPAYAREDDYGRRSGYGR